MRTKTLLLGYGNPDRGDDGAAWHILNQLFIEKNMPDTDLFTADLIPLTVNVDVWFNFQLLPEYVETIADFQKVVFIDAHTGEMQDDVSLQKLAPAFANSPFTHHMTPSSLLSIAESITGKYPESWMLSVRGYEFKFDCSLSPRTKELCTQAISLLKTNFLN